MHTLSTGRSRGGHCASDGAGRISRTVFRMLLPSILRPSSIAVVGATPRSFIGQVALRNCSELRFRGGLYPVSRSHRVIDGLPSYPDLAALPSVPEVALIQVRTEHVASVVEDGIQIGIKGFVIPGAGHTDSGEAAVELTQRLKKLHEHNTFEVIGPNCMGVVDLVTGAAPYVGTVPAHVRRGNVGVVAQSGAIVEAIINAGGRVPVSTVVSSGSEATTGLAQLLEFFCTDEQTSAVLAFVETITDAPRVIAAAQRLAEADKPLAVCLVGRSPAAQEGIAAHSGKLASASRVTAAAFVQAGAVVADDLDELLAMGELFATGRSLPRRAAVHVVTNSGGEANLIADLADEFAITLPSFGRDAIDHLHSRWPSFHIRNPLDPWGADDYRNIYPAALHTAAAEDTGNTLIVAMDQQRTSGEHEVQLGLDLATWLAESCADTGKLPVLLSPTSQDPHPRLVQRCRDERIALLRGARPGLSALSKLANRSTAPSSHLGRSADAPALPNVSMEDALLSVLSGMGVGTPRCIRVATAEAAVTAAAELGCPIVLKGSGPGLLHKTEHGLVRTGLTDPTEIAHEATRMLAWAENSGVQLELLVAEMVRGDLELIVGYKRDDTFGPTSLLGLGGIWTEFFDDVSIHVGHIDRDSAGTLVERSRAGRMLARSRSGSADLSGVVTALCAVGRLGAAHPEVRSIEINPLIVGVGHATAVDAVIERDDPQTSGPN